MSGRRASATTGIPATSSGWSCGPSAAVLLALFIEVATGTSSGMTDDLGGAAASVPRPAREFLLAVVQVSAVLVPVGVVVGLVIRRRWRRTAVLIAAAAAGALLMAILDALLDMPGSGARGIAGGWLAHLDPVPDAGLRRRCVGRRHRRQALAGPRMAARGRRRRARAHRHDGDRRQRRRARTAARPRRRWRRWRRACSSRSAHPTGGRRRRSWRPRCADAGLPVAEMSLERAVGGRSQLYRTSSADGARCFVKVYAQDSRDADLLYRGYRTVLLRDSSAERPATTLRVRRRARSAAADARPAGRRGVPAGARRHRAARRVDDVGDGRRRRAPPGRAGDGRAHPRPARRRLAAGRRHAPGRAWPTARSAPPTCSSPTPDRS